MRREAVALTLLAASLIAGSALRAWLIPHSTGSDIPQFLGFADTLLRHGPCFYSYSGSEWTDSEGWPYNWPYLYGPVWALILGAVRAVTPGAWVQHYWEGGNYYVYVSTDWLTNIKAVMSAFDAAVAVLIYLVMRRVVKDWVAAAAAGAYYLHPMVVYISGIYGMFDQVALAPFIASAAIASRYPKASGALTAVAAMTKQTLLPPIAALIAWLVREPGRLLWFLAGAVLAAYVILAPFALGCPSSVSAIISAPFRTGEPGYTYPIVYSFNGFSSLATYLHDTAGGDYLWLIKYWFVPFAVLEALAILSAIRSGNQWVPALAAYAGFVATYWRVNHQYLVPAIALALLAMPYLGRVGRGVASAFIAWSALWPFAFPVAWWFHVHIREPDWGLVRFLESHSLMIFDNRFYVAYSLTLTVLAYALSVCASLRGARLLKGSRGQEFKAHPTH